MKKLRIIVALTLVCVLSQGAACNKLVSNAESALRYARLAQPTVNRLLPSVTADFTRFIGHTEKLVAALKDSDSTTAKALLDELLPIFNDIVDNQIAHITDANTRTILMTALSGVDVALHLLVDELFKDAPVAVANAREASVIRAFQSRAVWGHRYRR